MLLRLLLDAQISDRKVGGSLKEAGYDVLSLDGEPGLRSLGDSDVLALAESEVRVVVTFDVGDFPPLLADWVREDLHHCGCVLVSTKTISPGGVGHLVRSLQRLFEDCPDQDGWRDRVVWLSG